MKPIKDRILVKPITEEKTKSGIIITQSAQKRNRAVVVEIGEKVRHIKKGDTVIYYEHSGIPLDYENIPHLMLREGTEKFKGDIISVL